MFTKLENVHRKRNTVCLQSLLSIFCQAPSGSLMVQLLVGRILPKCILEVKLKFYPEVVFLAFFFKADQLYIFYGIYDLDFYQGDLRQYILLCNSVSSSETWVSMIFFFSGICQHEAGKDNNLKSPMYQRFPFSIKGIKLHVERVVY